MKTEQKINPNYVPPMMEKIELEIEQAVLLTDSNPIPDLEGEPW